MCITIAICIITCYSTVIAFDIANRTIVIFTDNVLVMLLMLLLRLFENERL